MRFSHKFGFPSPDTFDCHPIGEFVKSHVSRAKVSIDPFARNRGWATFTNDLNPNTAANSHLDAIQFLVNLHAEGVVADLVILDPPYSPRQVKECYQIIGKVMTQSDGWTARYLSGLHEATNQIVKTGGKVLTFGWNSASLGAGWKIIEILLVNHGGTHNDTICTAQRKLT